MSLLLTQTFPNIHHLNCLDFHIDMHGSPSLTCYYHVIVSCDVFNRALRESLYDYLIRQAAHVCDNIHKVYPYNHFRLDRLVLCIQFRVLQFRVLNGLLSPWLS